MASNIKLDFVFHSTFETASGDYSTLDRLALHEAALGDLIFVVGDCDFSAPWGWVSAVYCAELFMIITDGLTRHDETQYFTFTENEEAIKFHRLLRRVRITASYAPGEAIVQLWDLAIALRSFSKRVVQLAARGRLGFIDNPIVQAILAAPQIPAQWADTSSTESVN